MRGGVLTAGGSPVHRVIGRRQAPDPDTPKNDTVPLIERYQDVAAAIHRTAVAPLGDRFLWGCSCGAYEKTPPGSFEKARLIAAGHVLDAAEAMYEKLEGRPIGISMEQE